MSKFAPSSLLVPDSTMFSFFKYQNTPFGVSSGISVLANRHTVIRAGKNPIPLVKNLNHKADLLNYAGSTIFTKENLAFVPPLSKYQAKMRVMLSPCYQRFLEQISFFWYQK